MRLPRAGLPGAAIALMAVVIALALFGVLDAQRRRAASGVGTAVRSPANAFADPPPLSIPASPPAPQPASLAPAPSVSPQRPPTASFGLPLPAPQLQPALPAAIVPIAGPAPVPPPPQPSQVRRRDGSALVIDGGVETAGAQGAGTPAISPDGPRQGAAGLDDTPVRAAAIRNRTTVMPVGTLIPAVLETPIDSARPGLVRAMVSQDARGFDGRRVLVPRGSRLIGEYQSDVRAGQNRVLVTWTRLIRPDGVAVRIGSPAADALGGAGVPGRVNSFFLQRFANAVLQSALTVGVNLASRPASGAVIVGVPTGPINTALGQGLIGANDLRPKITVRQGAALNVFVARDLDFAGTAPVQ